MAKVTKRQVVSAFMVMPPFEVVDVPKFIRVGLKLPSGDLMPVNVPIQVFENQEEYSEEVKKQVKAMEDGDNLARADEIELIQKGETNE